MFLDIKNLTYSYDGDGEDDYGYHWFYYSQDDIYIDMTFYLYEGEYIVYVLAYVADETETEIDYGTLNTPTTVTDAYNACANLASGEPIIANINGIRSTPFCTRRFRASTLHQTKYRQCCHESEKHPMHNIIPPKLNLFYFTIKCAWL